jgi:hypothetical protein
MKKPVRYSLFPDGIRPTDSGRYVLLSDYKAATDLLERFADLYGEVALCGAMIGPGRKLWREYYDYLGEHMILTDEGWESGESKAQYLIGGVDIYDEVNAPVGVCV